MTSLKKAVWPLIAIMLLAPVASHAREGVSVSLSVQEVAIHDTIGVKLSSKAQWTLKVVDLETGKVLINTGSDGQGQFIPGSLMKLFITAAVLEQSSRETIDLGTVVAANGTVTKNKLEGDIIITGSGNAFLTTKDLSKAVEKIKSLGIKEINGNVVVDDSLFDVKEWKTRYSGPAYGVPSALGLDMHTVSITSEGNPLKVSVDPLNDAVKVSINPSGKPGIRQIDDLTYEVTGVTLNAPTEHKRFPLADPASYAGGTFMALLKKSGIKVAGTVKRGIAPSPPDNTIRGQAPPSLRRKEEDSEGQRQVRSIARVGSRDINEFIRDTNQQSLNVAADNLLFLLGVLNYGAPGTKEKGIRAVNDFLRELDVPVTGLVVDDGSGVSEQNRITPEQMVTFLLAAARKPWFPTFFRGLSRPGMDGRLQDFGYRSDRMRLKSGQVRDAFCLAGYVDQKSGGKVAFAFMINGPDANTPAAPAAAVEVLKQLEL